MRINLIFDHWEKGGKPIDGEENLRLLTGNFHSGSTFSGTIITGDEKELSEALERGYQPVFIVTETR